MFLARRLGAVVELHCESVSEQRLVQNDRYFLCAGNTLQYLSLSSEWSFRHCDCAKMPFRAVEGTPAV